MRPFSDDIKIQFFNEMAISLYLYMMLILTDFNYGKFRNQLGWALLILVKLTVFINLMKALYYDSKSLIRWAKMKYYLH